MQGIEFIHNQWKRIEPFLFHHLKELTIAFILLILLTIMLIPQYETGRSRSDLTDAYRNLVEAVDALILYSSDNPRNHVFPPHPDRLYPGIVLCPLQDPDPERLAFLTTPAPFISRTPYDPFITQMTKEKNRTPIILHWVQTNYLATNHSHAYSHTAWGAFSIGPSLTISPQYDLTALRRVPYGIYSLRSHLFNPTNGLLSTGFLYDDSLGNTTPI